MLRILFIAVTAAIALTSSAAAAGESTVELLPTLLNRLAGPGPASPELLEIQRATRVPFGRGPEAPTHSFSFKLDPALGVLVPSSTGFGTFYSLRPETLGQGHFTVGVNYTRVDFTELDGADLDRLQIGVADGLVARVSVDIAQNVLVLQGSYGVLDELDVDLTLPLIHQFVRFKGSLNTGADINTARVSREVFGVGDIVIGAKYRFLDRAPFALAARLELSLPSGDEDDFLGVGTLLVTPSLIASIKAPFGITPHVNVGMRFSADTDKAEHQFFYIVGVEWQATSFLTLGLDFIGARIIDNKRPALREQAGVGFAPLRPASDDIVDVGISFKVNPWKNVVVTGGVLIPLNKTGLRAQVIPSIGVEVPF
jgi:hypothetical protein